MSKKQSKIQLANISTCALGLISQYSEAVVALRRLAEEYDSKVSPLEKEREELLEELSGVVMPAREAEINSRLAGISMTIMKYDRELKLARKPYRARQNAALALIPENIYQGYLRAWETGASGQWEADIMEFLGAIGLATDNGYAVRNFADTMKIRCAGSRRTSKKDTSGRILTTRSERQFETFVLETFIDYCVIEKRVLVRDEIGTLRRTIWEQTA